MPLNGSRPSILAAKICEDENGMREISRCLNPLSPRLRRGLNPVKPIAKVLIPIKRNQTVSPLGEFLMSLNI